MNVEIRKRRSFVLMSGTNLEESLSAYLHVELYRARMYFYHCLVNTVYGHSDWQGSVYKEITGVSIFSTNKKNKGKKEKRNMAIRRTSGDR